MREIVGAQIRTMITNSRETIISALESNAPIRFLSRAEMEFMASCDLGQRWKDMASGPTLFCLDDDGKKLVREKQP